MPEGRAVLCERIQADAPGLVTSSTSPPTFRYVEGYADIATSRPQRTPPLPIMHAWNLSAMGQVVDVTLLGVRDYFGVVLDPLWICGFVSKNGGYPGVFPSVIAGGDPERFVNLRPFIHITKLGEAVILSK
jgi:hypothetical protein